MVLANIQRGLLVRKVNWDQSGFIVVRQIAANKIKTSVSSSHEYNMIHFINSQNAEQALTK